MKIKYSFLLAFNFLLMSAFAQPFLVGHKQQTFVDSSRSNRNISAEIYYPSNTAGNNVPVSPGVFPVIVFGHGFVMTWSAYAIEWNSIVPQGYIMVFPTTETSFFPSHTDFAKDMAFLTRQMKLEGVNVSSLLYGAVAPQSAVMGHSMGGGCSLLAIQYDSAITALAALAPANTNPSSISAASNIFIPSLLFSGANDCVAPPPQNQVPMYDSLASSCKSFVSIVGGSHCQFADYNFNCSFGESTCSPAPSITPAAQQAVLIDLLLPWLNYYLKNDCSAGLQFQNYIATGNGITSQQNCSLVCTGVEENQNRINFSVYPNPFTIETELKFTTSLHHASITIFDDLGKLVKEFTGISGKNKIIPRGNLQPGLYFIQVAENGSTASVKKLMITDN